MVAPCPKCEEREIDQRNQMVAIVQTSFAVDVEKEAVGTNTDFCMGKLPKLLNKPNPNMQPCNPPLHANINMQPCNPPPHANINTQLLTPPMQSCIDYGGNRYEPRGISDAPRRLLPFNPAERNMRLVPPSKSPSAFVNFPDHYDAPNQIEDQSPEANNIELNLEDNNYKTCLNHFLKCVATRQCEKIGNTANDCDSSQHPNLFADTGGSSLPVELQDQLRKLYFSDKKPMKDETQAVDVLQMRTISSPSNRQRIHYERRERPIIEEIAPRHPSDADLAAIAQASPVSGIKYKVRRKPLAIGKAKAEDVSLATDQFLGKFGLID